MSSITDALAAEHATFCDLFDQIEKLLPSLRTLPEAQVLARLVGGLLKNHGDSEANLVYVALDHVLGERGRLLHLFEEHDELDRRLISAQNAQTLQDAQVLLRGGLQGARAHFRVEESVVFGIINANLEETTLRELGAAWLTRHTPTPAQSDPFLLGGAVPIQGRIMAETCSGPQAH